MVRRAWKRVSSRAMSDSMISSNPAVCNARLERANADGLVLSVPGTGYTLHLKAAGPTTVAIGKRIAGTVSGCALKFNRAHAGGEFIEPTDGHPRIVQGRIRTIDPSANRVLLQAAIPMWITLQPDQSAREFAAGDFVNFYMESGVTFTPQA